MDEYYSILGLSPPSNEKEIRKAYKKLALKVHPDNGGSNHLFQLLNEAYTKIMKSLKNTQPKKNRIKKTQNTDDIFDKTNYSDINIHNMDNIMNSINNFNNLFNHFSKPIKTNSNYYSESTQTIYQNGKMISKKIINNNGKITEQIIS